MRMWSNSKSHASLVEIENGALTLGKIGPVFCTEAHMYCKTQQSYAYREIKA